MKPVIHPARDVKFKAFIKAFAKLTRLGNQCSIEEARKLGCEFFLSWEEPLEPIHSIENLHIPANDNYLIPARLYTPADFNLHATLLFFHRGGWAFGSIAESDPFCRKLANQFNCQILSIDYRLAPEHPFPIGLNDCFDTAIWAFDNIARFGGDPDRLILSGESAGGNLAAAVALKIKNEQGPKFLSQLLLYPAISAKASIKGYKNNPDDFFLTNAAMKRFWSLYLSDESDRQNPYASLDHALDLTNLPPALIVTGECDPLRHEAKEFSQNLQKAAVKSTLLFFPDVIHGFLDLPIYSEKDKKHWLSLIKSQLFL